MLQQDKYNCGQSDKQRERHKKRKTEKHTHKVRETNRGTTNNPKIG